MHTMGTNFPAPILLSTLWGDTLSCEKGEYPWLLIILNFSLNFWSVNYLLFSYTSTHLNKVSFNLNKNPEKKRNANKGCTIEKRLFCEQQNEHMFHYFTQACFNNIFHFFFMIVYSFPNKSRSCQHFHLFQE